MRIIARPALTVGRAGPGQPRKGPSEDVEDEEEEGLELPVNPDEGTPLIPDDDERVVNVPS
ncbi:MAG: hypothetical protein A3E79_06115 [Burkholderiales bacterium RIFCSPHIGHO2_12_FULL_61_11]|nr:MAG: hypothetical protein A3E79_06115 [Burkholderiales bacterium RIFCSPHIGHO2_12_FULL_61_11]